MRVSVNCSGKNQQIIRKNTFFCPVRVAARQNRGDFSILNGQISALHLLGCHQKPIFDQQIIHKSNLLYCVASNKANKLVARFLRTENITWNQ